MPWGKPFPSNGMETATRYFSVVLAYIYKCKNSRCNVIPGHFQPGASNGVPPEKEGKITELVAGKKGHQPPFRTRALASVSALTEHPNQAS